MRTENPFDMLAPWIFYKWNLEMSSAAIEHWGNLSRLMRGAQKSICTVSMKVIPFKRKQLSSQVMDNLVTKDSSVMERCLGVVSSRGTVGTVNTLVSGVML